MNSYNARKSPNPLPSQTNTLFSIIFLLLQNNVLWSFLNGKTKVSIVKTPHRYRLMVLVIHLLQSAKQAVKFYNSIPQSLKHICCETG